MGFLSLGKGGTCLPFYTQPNLTQIPRRVVVPS